MCGIAGIYNFGRNETVDGAVLEKMNACMVHRGPDDGGVYVNGPVGLAMRRLSIIDLSSGHQPMQSSDGSLCLVFNGEIYNFKELRAELEKKGRPFKTNSDTEVILRLYEVYGDACVTRLRGMFAFALWDQRRRRLLLARDRMGKKPLLYSVDKGRICWASEMQSLLSAPGVSREINLRAIDMYLGLQYVPSPESIFTSVQKLPPAHVLIVEQNEVHIRKYWELPLDGRLHKVSAQEAQHTIREKLKEATRLRMISDVPLGAFLSGGIDSSVVVGLMSQLSDRPIKTFVIGFEEQDFSEVKYARAAAKHFGTDHTEFMVKPEMAEVLPLLAKHYGEPFGDSSALPTYYVARETRRHVTVALNGDGGDENFGGYSRYRTMKMMSGFDWLPGTVRRGVGKAAKLIPTAGDTLAPLRKARKFLTNVLPADPLTRYLTVVGIFFDNQKPALYTDAFRTRLAGRSSASRYLEEIYARASKLDPVNRLLYTDFSSYLPECLMAKMDIATMANSLEGRSPLLDHELIEYVFRLPGNWKLKGHTKSKWILKEAFKDMLPPAIMRRGKIGFGIPLGKWFRKELKSFWAAHVLSDAAIRRGYFKIDYLVRMFEEHSSGKVDHGYRMWTLLMLELWHEAYAPQARIGDAR